MPVPAFSMNSMRCSRSEMSGLRRTLRRPSSATLRPCGRLPGLITSMRSAYSSTNTLAPSKNQSRCMTALVIASRSAFIGYSGTFCRRSPSIR